MIQEDYQNFCTVLFSLASSIPGHSQNSMNSLENTQNALLTLKERTLGKFQKRIRVCSKYQFDFSVKTCFTLVISSNFEFEFTLMGKWSNFIFQNTISFCGYQRMSVIKGRISKMEENYPLLYSLIEFKRYPNLGFVLDLYLV